MLELKTFPLNTIFCCPDCGCKFGKSKDIIFYGNHILAECDCECCENVYFQTLPTEKEGGFSISISQKTFKARYDKTIAGSAEVLINSIKKKTVVERPITKRVIKESKEVIIFNCLDFSPTRVFLKLQIVKKYSSEFSEKSIIVLLPKSFETYLPEGIAEAWLVETKVNAFKNKILNLNIFVKEELKRFNSALLFDSTKLPKLSLLEKFKLSVKLLRK